MDRWEPGAFIEGSAYDAHVLGRPKVDRIKVLFMPDSNVVLASLLAREVTLSADTSLRAAQVPTVLKEWGPDHNKHFIIGVYLGKELIAEGEGPSKQEAQLAAAEAGLKKRDWD